MKQLDAKLEALAADPAGPEFIICYAADPDMGGADPFSEIDTALELTAGGFDSVKVTLAPGL